MAAIPAKAGTPIDPWSAGFMALGGIAQAAMQPGGPSSASGNSFAPSFDSSAWSVSIGSSGANGATNAKTEAPGITSGAGAGNLLGGLLSNPLILIALVAAVVLLRK